MNIECMYDDGRVMYDDGRVMYVDGWMWWKPSEYLKNEQRN
jgi:hypothetical protein